MQHLAHEYDIMPLILILAALAVLLGYGVALYNDLIRLRHAVLQRWGEIDTLLWQRHEVLPRLLEGCRLHPALATELLTMLQDTRAMLSEAARAANVGRIGELEEALRAQSGDLLASAAPLLADDSALAQQARHFGELQQALAERRNHYNGAVEQYNVRLAQFPASLVAAVGGLKPLPPLRLIAAAHDNNG